jgi:uncharacterized protein YdhG (YjbR/CyaY superfamily)
MSYPSVVKAGAMKKRAARQLKPREKAAGSPVDEYLAQAPPATRPILQKIRAIVREEAPEAAERISYRMPAFFQGGAIIYFAPFRHHVGIFPPVKGDAALEKALAKYKGEKGNLRFPLDEPMPYPLIRRVVRARLKALRAKQATPKQR